MLNFKLWKTRFHRKRIFYQILLFYQSYIYLSLAAQNDLDSLVAQNEPLIIIVNIYFTIFIARARMHVREKNLRKKRARAI